MNDLFQFTDDHNKGLNTSTILAGIGGFFGYIIGSVNWGETFLRKCRDRL